MIIKPDWDIFKSKFSDNTTWYFEWMCYLLFCREFNKPFGVDGYKNQAGIEMEPITVDNDVIGIQAKFYSDTLARHKSDMIEMLKTINSKYPTLNKLYFYSNSEWGQGQVSNDPVAKIEVENLARKFGIDIEWRLNKFFESPFVSIENSIIAHHFFTPTNMTDVYTRINTLNKEYVRAFIPLKEGIIKRIQLENCIEYIDAGKSFVIHGKAGRGKSGLTQNLVGYLKEKEIPCLAINLDNRHPEDSVKSWSDKLGFASNIEECLNYVSHGTRGVLILDQLDALRWTSAHSKTALNVCREIIDAIDVINTGRAQKISIVFVCRTYDLENDNSIKRLFKKDDDKQSVTWGKLSLDDLTEDETQAIIGAEYQCLNKKLQEVLRIPSNIYIWQQIFDKTNINECRSTYQLIDEWWESIKKYGSNINFAGSQLEAGKKTLIEQFAKSGQLSMLKRRLNINNDTIEFLVSQGFLVEMANKTSFAHQSILDCLLAQKMENEFLENKPVEDVLGENQTPARRFQLQLLLEMLLEGDSKDFLNLGTELIKSDAVRYSFKFVFYEMLNQIDFSDCNINEFILENLENEIIINNVILNNPLFIKLLWDKGILDKWISEGKNINLILTVIHDIIISNSDVSVEFIETHLEWICQDAKRMDLIFYSDFMEDSDKLFDLRMKVYDRCPQRVVRLYPDIKKAFIKQQRRAARMLKFVIQNDIESQSLSYIDFESVINQNCSISNEDAEYIITELVSVIPHNVTNLLEHSRWSSCLHINYTYERIVMELLKIAAKTLAENEPKMFFEKFANYFGQGSYLHNEIMLFAMQYLSCEYSDRVINYICSDFDTNGFDYTSDTDNKLTYVKEIIKKHSKYCNNENFEKLEYLLYYYKPNNMLGIANRRYEYRKKNKEMVTWEYHGAMQFELLDKLDSSRIKQNTKDYINVLNRKVDHPTIYKKSPMKARWGGASPLHNKNLNINQWLQIVTNPKITTDFSLSNSGVYYSIDSFADDFSDYVKKNTQQSISLCLDNYSKTRVEFVQALLLGISMSDDINIISQESLDEIILKNIYSTNERTALAILNIVSKAPSRDWHCDIISFLIKTALSETQKEEISQDTSGHVDMIRNIQMRSYNDVKCEAIRTLAVLLSKQEEYFEQFKDVVYENINDEDVAVRFVLCHLLGVMYIIDANFATPYIIKLFTEDILTTGTYRSDVLIYKIAKTNNLEALMLSMYKSEHELIYQKGTNLIVDFYLRDDKFKDIIENPNDMELSRKKLVVGVAVMYFDNIKFNAKCKEILTWYKNKDLDFEISRLFYDNIIDLSRDKDFVLSMNAVGYRTLHAFLNYLSNKALNFLDYSDVILYLCRENILNNDGSGYLHDVLPQLLFGVYDEVKEKEEYNETTNECLDLLDLMFVKNIGNTRELSKKIMDR